MAQRGFTLIELIVALAIIALLTSIVAPRYAKSIERAREAALRENLHQLRDAIDKFYADRDTYPANLEDLVRHRYLRAVPVDPLTGTATSWIVVPPASGLSGKVFDVRSGADGPASDGTDVARW
jgi:general secretion pathway protein G